MPRRRPNAELRSREHLTDAEIERLMARLEQSLGAPRRDHDARGVPSRAQWHSIATLATWGMTLVIQRAEHRDSQAIHAKLDELLKATHRANNDLIRIDEGCRRGRAR